MLGIQCSVVIFALQTIENFIRDSHDLFHCEASKHYMEDET